MQEAEPPRKANPTGDTRICAGKTTFATGGGIKTRTLDRLTQAKSQRFGTDPLGFEEEVAQRAWTATVTHDTLDKGVRILTISWMAVRDRLLQIAQEFYDKLGINAEIKDVTLTGSLANYNLKSSGLGLAHHRDFDDVDENTELVRDLMQQTKSMEPQTQHKVEGTRLSYTFKTKTTPTSQVEFIP